MDLQPRFDASTSWSLFRSLAVARDCDDLYCLIIYYRYDIIDIVWSLGDYCVGMVFPSLMLFVVMVLG